MVGPRAPQHVSATQRRTIALALLALVVVIGIVHADHGPAFGADDHGQYLLHAKALVEGRPYTDIGFVHTRYSTLVAPIAEPPGLPLLLAGVFQVAGQRTGAVRIILFASFVLLGTFVYRYFRTMASVGSAALVTAWTLTALAQSHVLDTVLADLPFSAALWMCFFLADSAPVRGLRRVVLLGVVGAAAFSFRMAALPLLPAAATAMLLRDQKERRGFLALGIVWTVMAIAVMFGLPAAEALGSETLRTPAVLWRDFLLNLPAIIGGAREGIPLSFSNRTLSLSLHAAVLGVALLGAVVGLRAHHRRFAWIAAIWYIVMLAALPTRSSQYMWALYPLLAFSFIEGVRWTANAAGLRRGRDAMPAYAAALALIVAGLTRDVLAPTPPTYTRVTDVTTLRAALAREDAGERRLRVVVFAPRVMAWEDGYITMAPFAAPPDEMLGVMHASAITHVVVGDAGSHVAGTADVERLVTERPTAFREVFRNASFRVMALMPKPPAS